MEISFIEIFTLIGIVHGFILGLIILFSRFFRNKENSYLGYTLVVLSIIGINNWFWDLGRNPIIISISDLFLWQFLYPVTLFLFFLKKVKHPFAESKKSKLLYIPFIILSVINILISFDTIFDVYKTNFVYKKEAIFYFYKIVSISSIIFPVILILFSAKYLFFTKIKGAIKWIKWIWIFMSFLEIYGIVLEGQRFLYGSKMSLTFLWIAVSIFMYWLIYKGLYQFKLSNEQYEVRQLLNRSKKEIRSTIKKETNTYIDQLIILMQQEHIHHNPDLSRDLVAKKLGISSGYLSQQINTNCDKNFSEFINHYRVSDIKQMILNPEFDKYSLLAIGMEGGFKSKTTFYTAFKKETGMSPNTFKKKYK
ncbi:helix-turn-helix domain-containing protein [uncultured Aquimarina sp.]|uniref:AraC family transcriptional regulator n=1 Tax=uncultured Aquimarina sp. TaxID=575652 RepID=UPI00262FE1FE|nr:helix-turn-helix domain-containing protein [uncultured Aquimarina sp.]